MGISRRQILFGSTFMGLAGGMSSAAQACSTDIVSPLEWRFWRGAYFRRIRLPLFLRSQSRDFLSAILYGSKSRLDALLSDDASLLLPPDGAYGNPSPGEVLRRDDALTHLSQLGRRRGQRTAEIHHMDSLSSYLVIVDVSMRGYGKPDPHQNPYGLCGSDPNKWSSRIIWKLEFRIIDISSPLIERVTMMQLH